MDFWFDLEFSIPHIILYLLEFALIAFLFMRIYKKREFPTKLWVAILATIIGLIALSIDIPVRDEIIHLSILPLGAWALYFLWKRSNKWETYRKFAWLGFLTSYISIMTILGAEIFHDLIYPKDDVSIYLANIEEASVIRLIEDVPFVSLNASNLEKQLFSFEEKDVQSSNWYHETDNGKPKRFPYQLIGTNPRFGSYLDSVIYIEKDGKGLLIQTEDHQYYFRSEQSFLEEGGDENEA
ncbi:hypothetical protein KO561_19790 [Radiobacillus kanasensis]|uniref:hypothetical protein n=1 Tax=Radiobacillus kanasensis TaxID=2844358 RepID=UPI001E2B92AB|nr:hypothetical protein [Radiobacillus kanasensis]UFT99379.1 hypothetical protein KO561_19790 [Radiobacillus kanasensis]